MFKHIFQGLESRFKVELGAVLRCCTTTPLSNTSFLFAGEKPIFQWACEVFGRALCGSLDRRHRHAEESRHHQWGTWRFWWFKHGPGYLLSIFSFYLNVLETPSWIGAFIGKVSEGRIWNRFFHDGSIPLSNQVYLSTFTMLPQLTSISIRPFYTMPCHDDPRYSNSYDMFIRGQEICSGAQRNHDPDLLRKVVEMRKMDIHSLESYIKSFEYGVNICFS